MCLAAAVAGRGGVGQGAGLGSVGRPALVVVVPGTETSLIDPVIMLYRGQTEVRFAAGKAERVFFSRRPIGALASYAKALLRVS